MQPSLVETTMKIDKSVSKQAFRRSWRIKLNFSKDRAKLVKIITLLFDESRKAEHIHEKNKCRFKWLRHRMPRRSAFQLNTIMIV